MYPVIHGPSIPYIGTIPEGVRVGTQVVINGHVPTFFSSKFDVNLVCGRNPVFTHTSTADIALHFNPRFNERNIVMNTRSNLSWGMEMRIGSMPIQNGYDFELMITVEETAYRITVNGNFFANYPHRIPYHDVGLLWIDGKVDIKRIQFFQTGPPSYTPAPVYPTAPAPSAPVVTGVTVAGYPTPRSSGVGSATAFMAGAAVGAMTAAANAVHHPPHHHHHVHQRVEPVPIFTPAPGFTVHSSSHAAPLGSHHNTTVHTVSHAVPLGARPVPGPVHHTTSHGHSMGSRRHY